MNQVDPPHGVLTQNRVLSNSKPRRASGVTSESSLQLASLGGRVGYA